MCIQQTLVKLPAYNNSHQVYVAATEDLSARFAIHHWHQPKDGEKTIIT
jgi:hypothetical protein